MEAGKRNKLYPLVLEPIFKYRIWGGRRLEKILGKKLPPDEPIGESWEVSCRNGDNNLIKNGELAGKTLADVFGLEAEALIGPKRRKPRFPLLNKFIDANALLSVQVHPDESCASRFDGAEAKTEAWYIIHADPGATLVKGLKSGVMKKDFEKAIRTDNVPDLLNTFPVAAGDTVFVPAGCVHAMGEGLVVCEIQENSDTTFRVYDWGRVGPDGRPRQLHIEQALQAINFDDRSPEKAQPIETAQGQNTIAYLAACPHFAMQFLTLREPAEESTEGRRVESLMFTQGNAIVRTSEGLETGASTGDSLLLPASLGEYALIPFGECKLLRIFVPDIKTDIVEKLLSRGVTEDAIGRIVFE